MDTIATAKQSWIKRVFQRIKVIFGPKRLSLDAGPLNITEDDIEIPNEFSFENINNIYNNYILKPNGKLNKIAINKNTGEEITDSSFVCKLEFANIWRKSASGNLSDEEDEIALPVCFGEEAKITYNKISKYSMIHLIKYGNIDTKEVLDITKTMSYKWSRQTARKLFKNAVQAQLLTDYYRLANPNAKEQVEKTLTTDQALYGLDT